MGISKKTLIIVSIIFSIILIALFFYLRFSVLEKYLDIEEEATVDKVMQVKKILNKNLDQVKKVSSSFSLSRQTYDYINGKNESFTETSLPAKLLAELGIDLFILADGNNNLKYAMLFDRDAMKKNPAPEQVTKIFTDEKFLKTSDNFLIERAGIMMIEGMPYFIVIKPVKPVDVNDMKLAGTLIMGQEISDEAISAINGEIKNEVSVKDISSREAETNYASAISNLYAGADYDITYISSKEIEANTLLNDLNGKPVLLLSVKTPRTVYIESRNNIYTLFFVIFFVGIISSLTIFFVIEKIVLSRIVSLSRKTEEIGKSKDLSKNVSFSGRDEVAKLAVSINRMLRDLKINELDIDGGASSINLSLGELHSQSRVKINSGASSITIRVPESFACEVNTSTVLSSKDLPGFNKIGGGSYVTPDFSEKENNIIIDVEAAVSSLIILRY